MWKAGIVIPAATFTYVGGLSMHLDVAHIAQWAEPYLGANQKFRGLETPSP